MIVGGHLVGAPHWTCPTYRGCSAGQCGWVDSRSRPARPFCTQMGDRDCPSPARGRARWPPAAGVQNALGEPATIEKIGQGAVSRAPQPGRKPHHRPTENQRCRGRCRRHRRPAGPALRDPPRPIPVPANRLRRSAAGPPPTERYAHHDDARNRGLGVGADDGRTSHQAGQDADGGEAGNRQTLMAGIPLVPSSTARYMPRLPMAIVPASSMRPVGRLSLWVADSRLGLEPEKTVSSPRISRPAEIRRPGMRVADEGAGKAKSGPLPVVAAAGQFREVRCSSSRRGRDAHRFHRRRRRYRSRRSIARGAQGSVPSTSPRRPDARAAGHGLETICRLARCRRSSSGLMRRNAAARSLRAAMPSTAAVRRNFRSMSRATVPPRRLIATARVEAGRYRISSLHFPGKDVKFQCIPYN